MPARGERRGWRACLVVLCLLASAGYGTGPVAAAPVPHSSPTAQIPGVYGDIPDAVEQVQPSVVTIEGGTEPGSGMIYRSDGYIVTNDHVVGPARTVTVEFADGTSASGTVVAGDPHTDIAVVRVPRHDLPQASLKVSSPDVGSPAVAVGTPLALAGSASAGIVSGTHRALPPDDPRLADLIQTDAAVSPGDSGGALVDEHGEVVGMLTAYLPPNPPGGRGAVSVGFAIPAATVESVADQLIERGSALDVYLGVVPSDLTPQLAREMSVQNVEAGALVQKVDVGGPADEAAIEPGDVITGVQARAVSSAAELMTQLRLQQPGEQVDITFVRNGVQHTVTATLTEPPGIGGHGS